MAMSSSRSTRSLAARPVFVATSAATQAVQAWAAQRNVTSDTMDGLTVESSDTSAPMWWFNLRPSNTEPLLRLNVEAVDEETMTTVRDEVLAIVRSSAQGQKAEPGEPATSNENDDKDER